MVDSIGVVPVVPVADTFNIVNRVPYFEIKIEIYSYIMIRFCLLKYLSTFNTTMIQNKIVGRVSY